MAALYELITMPGGNFYKQLALAGNFSKRQMIILTSEVSPITLLVKDAAQTIEQHYSCAPLAWGCSSAELAYKQWAWGNVSKNIPAELR
jgi:hypothetical protein